MLRAVTDARPRPAGHAPIACCGPRAGGLLHAQGRTRPQRTERSHFLLKDASFAVSIGEMLVLVQMASPPPAHAGPTVSHGAGGGPELRTAPLQPPLVICHAEVVTVKTFQKEGRQELALTLNGSHSPSSPSPTKGRHLWRKGSHFLGMYF